MPNGFCSAFAADFVADLASGLSPCAMAVPATKAIVRSEQQRPELNAHGGCFPSAR